MGSISLKEENNNNNNFMFYSTKSFLFPAAASEMVQAQKQPVNWQEDARPISMSTK